MSELDDAACGPLIDVIELSARQAVEISEINARNEAIRLSISRMATEREAIRRRAIAESRGFRTHDVIAAGAEYIGLNLALEAMA